MRTIGCGDRNDMIRLNTISSSQILTSLKLQPQQVDKSKPNSQAALGSYMNMTLLNVQPLSRRIATPNNPVAIDGLIYQHESLMETEGHGEKDASANVICNPQYVKEKRAGETFGVFQPQPRKPRSVKRKFKKRPSHPSTDDSVSEEKEEEEQYKSESYSEDKQPKKKEKKEHESKKRTTTTESPEKSLEWRTLRPLPSSEESDEDSSPRGPSKKTKKHKVIF